MDESTAEITKLRAQIESLEKLRGVLEDDVILAKRSELQDQLDKLIQTEGGAYVAGSVDTRDGDFIGRDKITVGDIARSVTAIGSGAQAVFNNIQTYIERELTEVEVAELTEALELRRLAEAVTTYVQRLQKQAEVAYEYSTIANPYKELLEYGLEDAPLFYGRSGAIRQLLNHLQRDQLTVLHSESGAGKTSLIKAGLMPRLLANGHVPVYLRPHEIPVHLALKHVLMPSLEDRNQLANISLHEYLVQTTDLLGGKGLVVIVDQFEEVFTVQNPENRAMFVDELALCLDDDLLPVRWVFAMRGEWLSQLGTFRPRIRNPFANEFFLRSLSREEAREVILNPALQHGVSYEHELVEKLLDDLGGDEIIPPQLQLVCYTLYESLNGKTQITQFMYTTVGETGGILRGHLDRVLRRDIPSSHRSIARRLLEALVTSERRRALRRGDELATELTSQSVNKATLDAVLNQLVDSRLVRVAESEEGEEGRAYELAHDFLLEEIELDLEVQTRKAARELIRQELENWRRFGTLIPADKLALLDPIRDSIPLEAKSQELLLRSALHRGHEASYWFTRMQDQKRAMDLLAEASASENPEMRARSAMVMGIVDSPKSLRVLTELAILDPNPKVRKDASSALANLSHRHTEIATQLGVFLSSGDRAHRRAAMTTLTTLSPRDLPLILRARVFMARNYQIVGWYLVWVLGLTFAIPLGLFVAPAIGLFTWFISIPTIGKLQAWGYDDIFNVFVYVVGLGVIIGTIQTWLVYKHIPRKGFWILFSSFAVLIGWLLGNLMWDSFFPQFVRDFDLSTGLIVSIVLFCSSLGAFISASQYLVLRGRVPQAGFFSLAMFLGFAFIGITSGAMIDGSRNTMAITPGVAILTGLTIFWLRDRLLPILSQDRLLFLTLLAVPIIWNIAFIDSFSMNPKDRRKFVVPVVVVGDSSDKVILNEYPETAEVSLSGLHRDLEELEYLISQENLSHIIRVMMDISELQFGEQYVSTNVEISPEAGPLQVEDIKPSEIILNIDKMTTLDMPIEIQLLGEPAPGYQVGSPEVDKQTTQVRGPEYLVWQVMQVRATLDVSKTRQSIVSRQPLEPIDDQGNVVPRLSLSPPVVEVTLPITLSP